jgi:hypothetical protein
VTLPDDDDDMMDPFSTEVDGREPRRFVTLQDAMGYVEGFEAPTGVIRCLGRDVVQYVNGNIALAPGFEPPTETAKPAPRTPKRPMFIISTEHQSAAEMKAQAQQALRKFQQGAADN